MLKCSKQICQKFSGRCDFIATTGKIRQVGALVKNFRSLHQPEKLDCPTVRYFLFALPGTGLWAAGSLPLSVRLLRRQNFGSPLVKIMIFSFAGNDLANDPAVTPANFSLPRQKIARLRNDSKDCAEANLHKSFST